MHKISIKTNEKPKVITVADMKVGQIGKLISPNKCNTTYVMRIFDYLVDLLNPETTWGPLKTQASYPTFQVEILPPNSMVYLHAGGDQSELVQIEEKPKIKKSKRKLTGYYPVDRLEEVF